MTMLRETPAPVVAPAPRVPAAPPPTPDPPAPRLLTLLGVHLPIIAVVWTAWAFLGGGEALAAVRRNWLIALVMVPGSLVGGGTSEGGGAVAFPVFTKALAMPAPDARIFTYLCQSVGMTAASLCILAMRVPIERRVVVLGSAAGVVGMLFGACVLAPMVAPPKVRLYFTVLLTCLAIALVVRNRRPGVVTHPRIPLFGSREAVIVIGAGLAGGTLSGLVGVGENTVMFIVLVLLFRVSEKVATPTTVVMMTVVSVAASLTHLFLLDDVSPAVFGYWLAAAPVVAVFAPIGAFVCAHLSRTTIWRILVGLIAVEFVSTLVLVPMTTAGVVGAVVALVVVTAGGTWLTRVRRYATPV